MAEIFYLNSAARTYLRTARERQAIVEKNLQLNEHYMAELYERLRKESFDAGIEASRDPSRTFPLFRNQHYTTTPIYGGAA